MFRVKVFSLLGTLALCSSFLALAQVEPERTTEAGKLLFNHPDQFIVNEYLYARQLPQALAEDTRDDLARMGMGEDHGALDPRTLRFATLLPSVPMIPGDGVGNNLRWENLAAAAPASVPEMEGLAWRAFVDWLVANEASLRIDINELTWPGRIAVHDDGDLIQIVARRQINGIPVRDSVLNATISHGNLILFGARNWGEIDIPMDDSSRMSLAEARDEVAGFLGNTPFFGFKGKSFLVIVPMERGEIGNVELGSGLSYRLAWSIRPDIRDGSLADYRALVDAHSGDLITFEDTVHYGKANSEEGKKGAASTRSVVGGVYPVSNDGVGPGGMEQAGFPMPFADIEILDEMVTEYTDTGGNLGRCVTGTVRTRLAGLYVTMNDNCGAVDETSAGSIDLEQGPGTDCVVPAGHSAGDTHATRTGFYELNRIAEMARAQLPNNSWLKGNLIANMNINQNCNATWSGQVNFYTSGGGCGNTGEIAAIFDHEWGHGMDDNDIDGFVGFPGEGIADIYSTLRLNNSCVGAGFILSGTCGGYGDGCLTCSGVRDVDWAQHRVGQPWNMDFIHSRNAWAGAGCQGCSGSSHCEGYLISSSVWDMVHRKLTAAPYNLDLNTALEIGTRLTYLGAGPTSTWFECSTTSTENGCAAGSGYMNYLAADDDNGNLDDGTPHMGAIFSAFNDHDIACSTPTVQDSGCAGAPTTAPVVNGTGTDRGAELTWSAVAGATRYKIYRTEGVFQCDFGKVLIDTTTDTTFLDSQLRNGVEYSYVIIAFGDNDACFGPASACTSVTPADGPNLTAFVSGSVTAAEGDNDPFVDNCELVTVTMAANNIGVGSQSNVRIVSVASASHPDTTLVSTLPISISASLGECEEGTGQIQVRPDGLAFGDTMTLTVMITSDQLAGRTIDTTISIGQTESDLVNVASQTFTFEAGSEGWVKDEGTFDRTAGTGANGSGFYFQSSANLNDQCDRILSPVFVPSATTTISVFTNFDIEANSGQWWDRANVGLMEFGSSSRTSINPDGGRTYNASGIGGTCGTENDEGWADSMPTWAESTFSAGIVPAEFDNIPTQIAINYGTDPAEVGNGFRFDDVTITNFGQVVPDTQELSCLCPADWTAWPDASVLTLLDCLDVIIPPTLITTVTSELVDR